MDEELTQEGAEWIVANRQLIRESGEPLGIVLVGEEAVKFLEKVFSEE